MSTPGFTKVTHSLEKKHIVVFLLGAFAPVDLSSMMKLFSLLYLVFDPFMLTFLWIFFSGICWRE
jgi:hypothetical protein